MNAAAEVIYDLVDPTANLIFGAVIDPSLSGQVSYKFHRNSFEVTFGFNSQALMYLASNFYVFLFFPGLVLWI